MNVNLLVTVSILISLPMSIARAHVIPSTGELRASCARQSSSAQSLAGADPQQCAVPSANGSMTIGQKCVSSPAPTRSNNKLQGTNFNFQSAIIYNNQGVEKFKAGDNYGAIQAYDRAIAVNPRYGASYVNRGIAKFKLGKIQAAIADYNLAIEIDPKDDEAYYNRGIAKFESGDERAAIADFDRAVAINPQDAEVYGNRGFAKSTLGDRAGALADLQQAARLFRQQGKMDDYNRTMELIKQMSVY